MPVDQRQIPSITLGCFSLAPKNSAARDHLHNFFKWSLQIYKLLFIYCRYSILSATGRPTGPLSAAARPTGPMSACQQPIRLTWQPTPTCQRRQQPCRSLEVWHVLSAFGQPTGPLATQHPSTLFDVVLALNTIPEHNHYHAKNFTTFRATLKIFDLLFQTYNIHHNLENLTNPNLQLKLTLKLY